MTREEKVAIFNEAAGKVKYNGNFLDESMVRCLGEEVVELFEAIDDYTRDAAGTGLTRENLVKEWADVQVTLSNLAWYFDIPGDEALHRVSESNNNKIVDGQVLTNEWGKVLKPEGWEKPNMKGL